MPLQESLLTLLHLLVLVYWLGGDLGAFYGSTYLTNPARSLPERMMALKILGDIDMAPKTALVLALPTGTLLAWAKGWLPLPAVVPFAIVALSLAWLVLLWTIHLRHDGAAGIKRIDIAIRWIMMPGLVLAGGAGLAGAIPIPFFIAAKLVILGACTGLGLIVRRQLVPMFPAIRRMAAEGPTAETDAVIAGVIGRTRPMVVCIWLLILVAAWLGIATPA